MRHTHLTRVHVSLRTYRGLTLAKHEIFTECRHLQSFCIDGAYQEKGDFNNLLKNLHHFYSVIKELELRNFYAQTSLFSAEQFIQILSKCTNIEHLKLLNVDINDSLDPIRVQNCCSKLHELSLLRCRGTDQLVRSWNPRIYSLTLRRGRGTFSGRAIVDMDWKHLCKLETVNIRLDDTMKLLNTASNLKEIHFDPQNLSDSAIKRFIVDCPSLEYLCITTRFLQTTCSAVYDGLFCTKTRKKSRLEIALMVGKSDNLKNGLEFMSNITKIITALSVFCVEEWILNVEAYTIRGCNIEYETNGLGVAINDLVDNFRGSAIDLMERTKCRFVIGNKGCKMLPRPVKWNNDTECAQ